MNGFSKKNAIALGFDPSTDQAPKVVAKGDGRLAWEIMKIAEQNNVRIIQDPDLAGLMSTLPMDAEIPENLYTAMAHIFAMVLRMRQEENFHIP